MKKKVISAVLTTAMVASMMVGTGVTSVSAETDNDEDVTITYWGWDSDFYEPMFAAYEEEHPNVHFEPTAVEWGDMLTKAQQALASGSELPVMIAMDNTLIENWKDMDICEDLKQYGFDETQYLDDLAEKTVTDDGKVIGVESSINPSGIAYKRDLAKKYFGTDDPDELFQIFNSFDAYAEKGSEVYEQTDGKVHLFHSGQSVAEMLYFESSVQNMDGNTLNYTDKMTDIMSTLIKLRDANAVDTYQNGTPEANATYSDDSHIFYPCPNWSINYYIKGNDPEGSGNWGLMHAPVDYNCGGSAHGITKDATDAQKQAAYDFLIWTSEGDGASILRDKANFITPYKKYVEDSEFTGVSDEDIEFFGGEDIGKLFYQEISPNMVSVPSTKWDNSMVNVRNDVAQQLMDDTSMGLDEAISIGKDEITQLVTDTDITIK